MNLYSNDFYTPSSTVQNSDTNNTTLFGASSSNRDLKHSSTFNSINIPSSLNANTKENKLITQGSLSARAISTKKSLDNNVSMIEFVNLLKLNFLQNLAFSI